MYGYALYHMDMAFIRTTTNKEGRTHVYLVEGYRVNGKVKQRIIKKYGLLDELEKEEPGILERLKREAKEGLLTPSEELTVTYSRKAPIGRPDQSCGWKLLDGLFRVLHLPEFFRRKQDSSLTDAVRLLTFQRILCPDSKIAAFRFQNDLFGEWDVSRNGVYRALDPICAAKEACQRHLHKRISELTDRSGILVFYDVTNYYFKTYPDDPDTVDDDGNVVAQGMRRRGPSKEFRPNPIVQLGLFMDAHGIPISYRLFRGNCVDASTYIPAVEEVRKQFGLERIVVVADKAMNSAKNLSKMPETSDGWIFSQKHRGMRGAPKDIQEQILDASGWLFNESGTFAYKSFLRERRLGNKRDSPAVREKVVITWRAEYAAREKLRRDGALAYAEKLTNAELFRQTAKKGGKKYLQLWYVDPDTKEKRPFSPLITFDREQIEFDEQFDGVHVLVTGETDMADEEIIAAYGELSKIEDCFRVTKSELKARPVFIWTKEHIEGHFFICFLALVMLRLLGHLTEHAMSPRRMIAALNSATASPLADDCYRLKQNEDMDKLNELLGIEWKEGVVTYEQLKDYGKGFIHNKKN